MVPRKSSAWLCALLVVLSSTLAAAQSADNRVKILTRDAMEQDYLAMNMKAALAKLQTALKQCGGDKCSKDVLARVHASMGIIYAAGLNQPEDAVESFKEMMRAAPTMTPDANYLTGAVQAAFDKAKAAMGGKDRLVALVHEPWQEQATWTPVPVYVEAPEGVDIANVVVRHKAPGASDWSEANLKSVGKGFGGYVPCSAVQKTGKLQYFVSALNKNLDRVGAAGSAEAPIEVTLKEAIAGRQPSLPGATPPSPCPRPTNALSCDTDYDCPGDQVCIDLECAERPPADPDSPDMKRVYNWLSLSFGMDVMLMGTQADVCAAGAPYSCAFGDGASANASNLEAERLGKLGGGMAPGSMRVLLGFDRVMGTRMTLGGRLGFAFGGYPETTDGRTFQFLHAAARFAFIFASDPFVDGGLRPYVAAEAGLGERVGRITTKVLAPPSRPGDPSEELSVNAFQAVGPFFVKGSGGAQYAFAPNMAAFVDVGLVAPLPEFAVVIEPTLGVNYGF